jgi:hypothetical protein
MKHQSQAKQGKNIPMKEISLARAISSEAKSSPDKPDNIQGE